MKKRRRKMAKRGKRSTRVERQWKRIMRDTAPGSYIVNELRNQIGALSRRVEDLERLTASMHSLKQAIDSIVAKHPERPLVIDVTVDILAITLQCEDCGKTIPADSRVSVWTHERDKLPTVRFVCAECSEQEFKAQ
jgi:hypothetical protein